MLIAGAGGHAIELLGVISQGKRDISIAFFDDVTLGIPERIFGSYPVIRSLEEASLFLTNSPDFALGVGDPSARKSLCDKLCSVGGKLVSVISELAQIGQHDVCLGQGLNIMTGAVLTERLQIGQGTLIHVHASVHHDAIIGEYCEISPGCRILGRAKIGSFVSIGANAVVLPRIHVGDHAIIGAGAVVNRNVPAGISVAGVPAKPIRRSQ